MKSLKRTIARILLLFSLSFVVPSNVSLLPNTVPAAVTVSAAYGKATIQSVQEKLNQLGYDCGKADGVMGKKTKAAIKEYQSDNNLKATGNINKTLLKSLGISTSSVSNSSSNKKKSSNSSSTSSKNKETTVYVTKTGKKYHRSGCRYLRQSKIAISLSQAKKNYTPCSVCNP